MRPFLALLVLVLVALGCDSGDPDMPDPVDQPPQVSSIFPSVVIPNGYVYVRGQNLNSTTGTVSVVFLDEAGAEYAGSVTESTATELTVLVPRTIPVTGGALSVRVTTPGGSVDVADSPIYGVESSAFGDELLPGRGLLGTVYPLAETTTNLPDFSTLQPVSLILAPNLDVPTRSFSDGFPGVPGGLIEWFGIQFTSRLDVPAAGRYTFRLRSDDGSKLYIDGDLVVDNDGLHAALDREGSVELTAGLHDLRVDYFQGPRFQIALQLSWQAPGEAMTIIPATAFALPAP